MENRLMSNGGEGLRPPAVLELGEPDSCRVQRRDERGPARAAPRVPESGNSEAGSSSIPWRRTAKCAGSVTPRAPGMDGRASVEPEVMQQIARLRPTPLHPDELPPAAAARAKQDVDG